RTVHGRCPVPSSPLPRREPAWSARMQESLLPDLTGCLPRNPSCQFLPAEGRSAYGCILIHRHLPHFSSTGRIQTEMSCSDPAIRLRTVSCPSSFLQNSEAV